MSVSWETLVEYQRADRVERSIQGSVCYYHGDRPLHVLGEDLECYPRSLLKPLQIKTIAHELDSELSWSEKALSISSHNAEDKHLSVLKTLLSDLNEEILHLPEAKPLSVDAQLGASKLYHPCSAKHAAVLRACQLNSWPTENYFLPEHPYQKQFLTKLSSILRKKSSIWL